jgi:hypothetical protein
MNERIQQLAEQVYGTQATEQEIKFAELIVKECAKSIEKTIEVNCDTDDEKMGCEFAITDLLEHFGVKE